ncbi:MAG: carboxypeptidase-like regulatory domain-containing protein [Candidatus Manganitrophus sp.]|nr:carboxypeptidase-like regulatory domain-containing protein [Candidatus Manganitrophus sp.]
MGVTGGRGNARIKVFANKISVGKLQVIPIAISTVGVTGSVIEAKDESTAVPQATISVLGTNDPELTTPSDANGLYSFVSMGTNGNYFLKVSKSGHWDSYHSLNTTPFQAATNIQDVTKTVSSYSNSYIGEIASAGRRCGQSQQGDYYRTGDRRRWYSAALRQTFYQRCGWERSFGNRCRHCLCQRIEGELRG